MTEPARRRSWRDSLRLHLVHLVRFRRHAERVPPAMRLIAGLALVKAVVFLAAGLFIGRIIEGDLMGWLAALLPWVHVDGDAGLLHRLLVWVDGLGTKRLQAVDAACFAYFALYTLQGLGLWFDRRWASWLTVVMAGLLIPVEVWEVAHHPRPWNCLLLMVNLAVVAYLIHHLRHRSPPG